MKTYDQLKKEAACIDRKLAVSFANERAAKINEIIAAMREYKIQPEDIGRNTKAAPRWVNVKTGETWSGRGKHPHWVISKDAAPCFTEDLSYVPF